MKGFIIPLGFVGAWLAGWRFGVAGTDIEELKRKIEKLKEYVEGENGR